MILVYGRVATEGSEPMTVSANTFWRQMEQLRRYRVVYLDEYNPENPENVVITFDGVDEGVYRYAFPVLNYFDYPFELFVIGNAIGRKNYSSHIGLVNNFANFEQLKKMIKQGGRLQWLGLNCKDLTTLQQEYLFNELKVPENIRRLDTQGFKWFAYPYGRFNKDIKKYVMRFFKGALTIKKETTKDIHNLNRIPVNENTSFSKTKVSVIIPNFNYGCFVSDAIESALKQTVLPDEILLIDDHSTDNTMDIIEPYKDRIRIVRNEKNLGPVKTFNKGVYMTSGDYFVIVSADDRIRSDYIEKCKYVLDTNPDTAIAYTHMVLFGERAYEKAEKLGIRQFENLYLWDVPEFNGHTRKLIKEKNFIHGSAMIRRDAFYEAGGYMDNGHEDHDLYKRIISNGWKAHLIPEYLLEYRQHSLSQRNNIINLEDENRTLRRMCKDMEERISRLLKTIKDYSVYIEGLEKVVKILKQIDLSEEHLNNLTEILLGMMLVNDAEFFAKRALEKNPLNMDSLNNLAVVYTYKGLYSEAFQIFNKILEVSPEHESAKKNLEILAGK